MTQRILSYLPGTVCLLSNTRDIFLILIYRYAPNTMQYFVLRSDSMCSVDGMTEGHHAGADEGPLGPDLMYEDHDPIIDDM